jgi:hypothetical protein
VRKAKEPLSARYPPVPPELLELVNSEGRFRYGGYLPHDGDHQSARQRLWQKYKRLKIAYCAEADIKLNEFKQAVRSQR